jgi:DNA-binding response OmpR family regulator
MKILLIEDDLDLGAALQRSLDQANLPSVWVRRLADGMACLQANDMDCVLLDINLPDGEGFTLLEQLRRKNNSVPVLVMTARDALDDRLRALNGGADDYVIKPFMVPELIARIHVAIRRSAGQAASAWQVGSIAIDPQQQTVTLGGVELAMTPREFNILCELARQAGRVVRREQLVQRVWSGDDEPSAGALEFQIHALRRKLGADAIRTVRGVGYLMPRP